MDKESIPRIHFSDFGPDKQAKVADGTKLFDMDTNQYFEKVNGKFELMVEEKDNPGEPIPKVDLPPAADIDASTIRNIVASGDRITEANTYMKLASVKNELESQKTMISQKMNFIFAGTPEQLELMDLRVADAKEEAIKNGTMDEIKAFFTFDDKFVDLNFPDPNLPDDQKLAAYKEYLLYLKSIDDAKKEIDNQVNEINNLCTNFSDELKTNSKSMYEWDKYIYDLFKARLAEKDITPEEKARIERLIEIRDDALTLAPLYKAIKDEIDLGKRRSIVYAFQTRFEDTLKKCEQYAVAQNFHIYFQLFDGIEEKLGYGDYRNLFVYLYARWIKYNREKLSKMDNAFIAQISQNLILLKKGEMKEPNKSKFEKAVKDILDVVIGPH